MPLMLSKFGSVIDAFSNWQTPACISSKLVSIESTVPMEIVCLDNLTLKRSNGGIGNVFSNV